MMDFFYPWHKFFIKKQPEVISEAEALRLARIELAKQCAREALEPFGGKQ